MFFPTVQAPTAQTMADARFPNTTQALKLLFNAVIFYIHMNNSGHSDACARPGHRMLSSAQRIGGCVSFLRFLKKVW